MKKRSIQISILIICSIFLVANISGIVLAADKKITELTELTTPVDVDLVVIVDDPAGSPVTKKLTWANIKATLKTYFDTLYNNYVHPNHTGDVTSVADGAQTITAKAVTLAKMDDMATASLLGRNTAGVGVPEVLSKVTALSLLNVADGADVTGSNAPQAHAASHQNGGGDEISIAGLSGLLADDQHVLDAEVLAVAAAKGANADITSTTALTQITRATGGAFDIAIGGAAGDDFTVDTDKLVIEGDNGNVGIGTSTPAVKLDIGGHAILQESGDGRAAPAADTDPHFRVYSSDAGVANDYVEMYHNQTYGDVYAPTQVRLTGGTHATVIAPEVILDATSNAGVKFKSGGITTLGLVGNSTYEEVTWAMIDTFGNQIIFTNYSNGSRNHDHPVQTNPTLFINSDLNPNVSNNQWGALAHDQENLVITTGANVGVGTAPTTDENAITFAPRGAEQVRIEGGGNVGIGTTAPGNPLAINRSADGVIVDFESADTVEGNISITDNTTSYNAFVGSHYTQLGDGQKELPIGAVVISTGEIISCEANIEKETEEETEVLIENAFEDIETEENGEQIGETIEYKLEGEEIVKTFKPIYEKIKKIKRQIKANHALNKKTGKICKTETTKQIVSRNVSNKEYFTYIDTTKIAGNKAVYGVWLGKMSDDSKGSSFGQDDKPVYLIAQVGLFKIRVTDTNGNIGIGDYLETSTRPMEAQTQNDSHKVNSTIAKAMVNVDWATIPTDIKLGYKWQLIPCIF